MAVGYASTMARFPVVKPLVVNGLCKVGPVGFEPTTKGL